MNEFDNQKRLKRQALMRLVEQTANWMVNTNSEHMNNAAVLFLKEFKKNEIIYKDFIKFAFNGRCNKELLNIIKNIDM